MMLEDEKDEKGKTKGETKGGKAGDTAMYRTNDPEKIQQFHLTDEGPRLTSVQTQKFALVASEGGQQQQAPVPGKQSGQSSKADGQRPIFKKESTVYVEQTGSATTVKHGAGTVVITGDKVVCQYEDDKISTLVDKDHVHIRFKDHRIFVDKEGCWSTSPIQVKGDDYDH